MTEADELHLWLGAVRYYLGRQSIAVSAFCDMLIRHWPSLNPATRALLVRDIEKEFTRDERARELEYPGTRLLGDEYDRQSWETVRALWRHEP